MGISWEFFDTENNKRLIIKEGTTIEISKTATDSELKSMLSENSEAYKKFINEHKEYQWEKFQPLIDMAIEKWIEPQLFIISGERRIEEFGDWPLNKSEIENLATDIHRSLSWSPKVSGKYNLETATKIFRYTNPTTWKEGLENMDSRKRKSLNMIKKSRYYSL